MSGESVDEYMARVFGPKWYDDLKEQDKQAYEQLKEVMERANAPGDELASTSQPPPPPAQANDDFTPISAEDDARLFRGIADDDDDDDDDDKSNNNDENNFKPLITQNAAALLVGFATHEWPVARQCFDEAGGKHVSILPVDDACVSAPHHAPSVLHLEISAACDLLAEPDWSAPSVASAARRPAAARAVIFVGLAPQASLSLARALEARGIARLGVGVAREEDKHAPVGEVAHGACKAEMEWRRNLGVE